MGLPSNSPVWQGLDLTSDPPMESWMVRRISRASHGIFDYFAGLALLTLPTIFAIPELPHPAQLVPRILGLIILGQSLITDYEGGVLRILPLRFHILIDYLIGVLLIAAPWLFRFHSHPRNIWMPDVLFGAGILLITLLAQTENRGQTARS